MVYFELKSPEQKAYARGETVAKCLADQTGGLFVSTETVEELVAALETTLGCPVIGWLQGSDKTKVRAQSG